MKHEGICSRHSACGSLPFIKQDPATRERALVPFLPTPIAEMQCCSAFEGSTEGVRCTWRPAMSCRDLKPSLRCASRPRPIPDWGTVPFEGIEGTVGLRVLGEQGRKLSWFVCEDGNGMSTPVHCLAHLFHLYSGGPSGIKTFFNRKRSAGEVDLPPNGEMESRKVGTQWWPPPCFDRPRVSCMTGGRLFARNFRTGSVCRALGLKLTYIVFSAP